MLDKYRARNVKREISRVLWDVWDPIGVNGQGAPRDEYDDYVNGVYELLITGASDDAIADHLQQIASEIMGLNGVRTEHMLPTVAALREIRMRESE
jgi:hypothetical protein